jgi:beta-lactamase class A
MPTTRRTVLTGALASLALSTHSITDRAIAADATSGLDARLAEIEAAAQGRLGVAIIDTKTGALVGRRLNERFPLCSTFKVLAAAFVLDRVDHGNEKLDRRITFTKGEVLPHSPVTKSKAGEEGATLAELCAAAIIESDNTAANLMLASFGGPQALTQYMRTLGDKATRIDRTEMALNDVPPGDPRDGTTPRAMAYTVQRILLGNVLSKPSEKLLTDWMVACKTGNARLRAGLPKDWRVGDKTGTYGGSANDVAIAWPPGRPPVVIAAYLAESKAAADVREKALADVGRVAATLI